MLTRQKVEALPAHTVDDALRGAYVLVREEGGDTVLELSGPDAKHLVGKKGVTLDALQLLANDRRDRPATIAAYRRALALGARAGVRDLFAAAGLRFDLSVAAVTELMQLVRAELARLA